MQQSQIQQNEWAVLALSRFLFSSLARRRGDHVDRSSPPGSVLGLSQSPTTGFQLFSYYVKPVGERRRWDVPRQLGGAWVVAWDEPAVAGSALVWNQFAPSIWTRALIWKQSDLQGRALDTATTIRVSVAECTKSKPVCKISKGRRNVIYWAHRLLRQASHTCAHAEPQSCSLRGPK